MQLLTIYHGARTLIGARDTGLHKMAQWGKTDIQVLSLSSMMYAIMKVVECPMERATRVLKSA